jgi:hypothetical protein
MARIAARRCELPRPAAFAPAGACAAGRTRPSAIRGNGGEVSPAKAGTSSSPGCTGGTRVIGDRPAGRAAVRRAAGGRNIGRARPASRRRPPGRSSARQRQPSRTVCYDGPFDLLHPAGVRRSSAWTAHWVSSSCVAARGRVTRKRRCLRLRVSISIARQGLSTVDHLIQRDVGSKRRRPSPIAPAFRNRAFRTPRAGRRRAVAGRSAGWPS